MQKLIIDTNIILYSVERKIDLFEAIKEKYGLSVEIIIPNLVLVELEKLSKEARKGSDKKAAKLSLDILKTKEFETIKLTGAYADPAILNYAKKNNAIVATMDARFQTDLKKNKIQFTFLNNKKKLD
jgi:rRNA-processing protein FCF1